MNPNEMPVVPIKIFNLAPFTSPRKVKLNVLERLRGLLHYGRAWYRKWPAQEALFDWLQRYLDHHYMVIFNFRPGDEGPPFPPIVVGVGGVHLMYPLLLEGDFRIQGDTLMEYDERSHNFRTHEENDAGQLLKFQQALQKLLNAHLGEHAPQVQALLVFLHPDAYVEAVDPAVKHVLIDGLVNYLRSMRMQKVLSRAQVGDIVRLLADQPAVEMDWSSKPQPAHQPKTWTYMGVTFTYGQWAVLLVLALLTLMINLASCLLTIMLFLGL